MDNDQETRLSRVEDCTDELTRAIKGHNGEPGIKAEVLLVKKDLATLRDNDLPHLKKEVMTKVEGVETALKTELLLSETKIMTAIGTLQKEDDRLKDFFRTYIWPLLMPIILGVIMWFVWGKPPV